jgi:hypothetical protein
MRSLKNLYLAGVQKEVTKYASVQPAVITEAAIAHLPAPVQRFFRHCGYIGRQQAAYAFIEWQDVYFRRSRHSKWMKMDCHQFNAVSAPARIVYMKARLAGLFPFEGRDKYQDGHGNMLIRLLKLFTVTDAKGPEMDASALVTVLSETFLVPSYALQPYLHWEAVDEYSAKASLQYNGMSVAGQFYFNGAGECTRFETKSRYRAVGKKYQQSKWVASLGDYAENNGLRAPATASAAWHDKDGVFEYFKGYLIHSPR